MKIIFSLLLACLVWHNIDAAPIVAATKRIYLDEFQGAYNPSLIAYEDGYLLTFRHSPQRYSTPWVSLIGIVKLDKEFNPVSRPQILDTRVYFTNTPQQAEDARIFSYNGKIYVIYNDNVDILSPSYWDRRDMYMAELFYNGYEFAVGPPLKLIHEKRYPFILWQKNWSPFVWKGTLLLSYTLNPHEVLIPNLKSGTCYYTFDTNKSIQWNFGSLRGGTPAKLVGDEYLAFFHSCIYTTSTCSDGNEMWHYVMGAYTFDTEPPFELRKVSAMPIDTLGFYTYSAYWKRVIYPGGFEIDGRNLYLAYGKDDSEMWIATINLDALMESLVPVE